MTASPTPSREELRAQVAAVLADIAPEVDLTAIPDEAPLREAADLDSMDMLNLVLGLAQRLEVEIPEADYAQAATVGGLLDYLARALAARPAEGA